MLAPLMLALALQAQAPFTQTLSPGTTYDPAIPTLESVVGHDFDEEITAPALVTAYMRALAAASDRAHLVEYGESWEGRPLVALVIGSEDRIARIDEIKAGLQVLANPDLHDDAEVERHIAEMPVVTVLAHSIHGNEISGAGAAMAEAYHLLAATNDPRADLIVSESLVLIDPMENPDGRARVVLAAVQGRARWPDANPISAEHDEPWPSGRTNHYLFDLNRDWFAHTQSETRGRIAMLLEYPSQVLVDLHEMGGNSTYYFPPPALPSGPFITEDQHRWYDVFGRNNAEEFDTQGFPYFTRDVFDSFYPGYGDTWPTAHGGLGMTFEQASAGALVFERTDGSRLTYGMGVRQHWTAALRTAHTAATNREAMLRDYVEFRRSAIAMADEGTREYVLHSAHDPTLARRLAELLVANGIRVGVNTESFTVEGRTFGPGTAYVVPAAQPAGRLVRNLLDEEVRMDPAFVQRQIERRARRQPAELYDITAWSLPLLWDVESIEVERATGVTVEPVSATDARSTSMLPGARVGYLIPWNSAGATAVAEALREGLMVRAGGKAFVLDGREYGVGTAIVRTSDNGSDVGARLGEIAARHGAEVIAVDESYVDSGMSLGANQVSALQAPKVMLSWGRGSGFYSPGWARYVLERRYGIQATAVRVSSMSRAILSDWDVIVLTDSNPGFSDGFVGRLRQWMSEGGTLITMGNSSAWAAWAGLLRTDTEQRGGEPRGTEGEKETQEQPIDYLASVAPATEAPERVAGAILNVDLDTTHWLASGTDGRIGVMVNGSRVFTPLTLDEGQNVGIYAPPDEVVASGIVWEEARPQLPYKAYLMHQPMGRGRLVAFAEDPNYRAYSEAGMLLFVNAVLLGSAR